jgi:hypothetical protein
VLALQLLCNVLVALELEQQHVRHGPQKLADVESGDMEGIDVAVDKDRVEVDIGHTVYPLEDQLVARQGIHRRVEGRSVLPAGVRDPLHVLLVQSSGGIRYLAGALQLEVDLGGGSLRITTRLVELGIGGLSPLPASEALRLQGHPSTCKRGGARLSNGWSRQLPVLCCWQWTGLRTGAGKLQLQGGTAAV